MARGVPRTVKKREEGIAQNKVICKCSCVTIMTPKTDWCICRHCGNKLYRTSQLKFMYEMKERLNK